MAVSKIEVVHPQFQRTAGMGPPPHVPQTDEDWHQLARMTPVEAKERGFASWDGGLFLIPGEWHRYIPDWLEVESIMGRAGPWDAEDRSEDIRFGCLAYGIRITPTTEGSE